MVTKKFLMLYLLFAAAVAHADDIGVGFVKLDGDGNAYLYSAEAPDGRDIRLQFPGDKDFARCCITAIAVSGPLPQTAVSDEAGGKAVYLYKLKLRTKIAHPRAFVGAAVIGARGAIRRGKHSALMVRTGGKTSMLNTCLSSEGVHLTRLMQEMTVAHLYYGLDYSVEPTCAESVYRQ